MSELLTLDLVRSHVRSSLGARIVRVELTDENLNTIVRSGVNAINRYKPLHRHGMMPTTAGRYYITAKAHTGFDSTVLPGFQQVINVQGVRDTFATSGNRIDLFDPLVYLTGSVLTQGGLASYYQALAHLEMARRLFSAELEWRGQWVPVNTGIDGIQRVYELYVDVPSTSRIMYSYEYLASLTPDDSVYTGIGFVATEMQDWFLRFCVAEGKIVLGRALRKFQGIPSPDGADMQVDGLELATDGDTEKVTLLEELMSMSKTIGPVVG